YARGGTKCPGLWRAGHMPPASGSLPAMPGQPVLVGPALIMVKSPWDVAASRPFHHRRHGGEDRVDISAGLEPEHGAAVVQQVELEVAAAPDHLLLAFGLAPRREKIAPPQFGIDFQDPPPPRRGKGKVTPPAPAVEPVVKNTADAAHLAPVLEKKIL